LRAIPPKSADIFSDLTGANIQQSIPPKLVSNDGIPPKAVFKSEIWKFCRNPKSEKKSIHLEFSDIKSDCARDRVLTSQGHDRLYTSCKLLAWIQTL
jgi:hypothetical protein